MKIWTASAVSRYYLDPAIALLGGHGSGSGHGGSKGYYIVRHCDPRYSEDFGGISAPDLGPFQTRAKARNWSRKYMAGTDGRGP